MNEPSRTRDAPQPAVDGDRAGGNQRGHGADDVVALAPGHEHHGEDREERGAQGPEGREIGCPQEAPEADDRRRGTAAAQRAAGARRSTIARSPPPFSPIPRAISSWGRPLATCHARLGAQMSIASAAPAHGHGDRSTSRRWTTSPMTRPPARNRTRCLFMRPTPATRPTTSHSRGSAPRRSRVVSHRIAAQARRSYVAVTPRCPAARKPDAARTTAARTCARRVAPSSRAMPAVSTTMHATATAGRRRTAHGSRPEERDRACGQDGRQRRLVVVAPGRMAAGNDEVQLVAMEAVRRGEDEQREQDRSRHEEDRADGERLAIGDRRIARC